MTDSVDLSNTPVTVSVWAAHAAAVTCAEQVPVGELRAVLEALGLVPTTYNDGG